MDTNLGESVWRIVTKLLDLAATDEQLRNDIGQVAEGVLQVLRSEKAQAVAEEPAVPVTEAASEPGLPSLTQEPPVELPYRQFESPPSSPVVPTPPLTPDRPPVAELAKLLTLGGKRQPPMELPEADEGPDDEPLPLQASLAPIEKRCLVKAEAARWAIRRQQRLDEGADFFMEIDPKDRDIIQKGKDAGTFLWMCHPSGPAFPENPTRMDEVANCFETLVSGVAVVRDLLNETELDRDSLEQGFNLLAEADCALRVAVAAVGWASDKEQLAVHHWLRGATYQHQIFVPKYMAVTDSAEPLNWPDLANRIGQLDDKIENRRGNAKTRRNLLNTLRYHAKRIQAGNDDAHEWNKTVLAVDQLVATGMPPSAIDIRDAILPIVDACPEIKVPDNYLLVLREIDRYLAAQPDADEAVAAKEPSKEVKEVAGLLQGRKVVLIGGNRRPAAQRAIEKAFGLKELNWVRSEEHESVASFESSVADPEVALVILMIRWSSHSYGTLQETCEDYGRAFLRLPGGYSPNQIAHQVLEQCSGKLKKPNGK